MARATAERVEMSPPTPAMAMATWAARKARAGAMGRSAEATRWRPRTLPKRIVAMGQRCSACQRETGPTCICRHTSVP
ncbi:MAG: hypothetical protein IPF99_30505 [Deltaproteobacteria bacterium]|nr:hypothetical protein [Deltaproteobacteria bacterium]